MATPEVRQDADALIERAATLQTQYHFRYPLSELVGKRVPARSNEDGELLTDDFAPVNLYETILGARTSGNNNTYGRWAGCKKHSPSGLTQVSSPSSVRACLAPEPRVRFCGGDAYPRYRTGGL